MWRTHKVENLKSFLKRCVVHTTVESATEIINISLSPASLRNNLHGEHSTEASRTWRDNLKENIRRYNKY
jgi:hypothetical protein